MTIIDPKWGAEIVTNTGKVLKFDVVECMVSYKIDNFKDSSKIQSIWTINYANPGEFINAKDAIYARSNEFNSPMGLNAVSVKTKKDIEKIKLEQKPEIISWNDLKNLIKLDFYGSKF
jgi:copper chaperone NosL